MSTIKIIDETGEFRLYNLLKQGSEESATRSIQKIVQLSDTVYHVLLEGRSIEVELVNYNKDVQKLLLKVNGKQTTFTLKSKTDLLLEKMGIQPKGNQQQKELKAPMPGLVVDMLVKEGELVTKGQPVLILEAMKMENILKAPAEGIVKAIYVAQRQTVDKNHVLLSFQ